MRFILLSILFISISCWGVPESAQRHASALASIIQQADNAYYNKNNSIMSDDAYDALSQQYKRLCDSYPELRASKTVGAPTSKDRKKVMHSRPMLSLKKTYDDKGVASFVKKSGMDQTYCIEPKIDGLTVVLRYENGLLTHAITRGDGQSGEDITAAILASGAVPHTLKDGPNCLEVRGEAFLTTSDFNALNERRKSEGLTPLKTARNTASGTVRLLDYAELSRRNLSILIFEWVTASTEPKTHEQALKQLADYGLPVIDSKTVESSDVITAIEHLNSTRPSRPYSTDGIVIRVNNRANFNQLGSTSHHPRGALARKYKDTPVETTLLSVKWTKGKTGKITPIAQFDPIEIDGATIQHASLHNGGYIKALDLKIGDRIQVIRAGGTIPEIIGNLPEKRSGAESAIKQPAF